ncbi:FAD-dependent oxidoreductase [Candidatus Daviesbacteria bacterium]|nr:FAD-dependent oxidoreductase [Candidatus Daviesbacteria bacterium]
MQFRFIQKKQESSNAYSFFFDPEQSDFSWNAGQYLVWEQALTEVDPRGNKRPFTIATSPSEKTVAITTKISGSPFKKQLLQTEPGAILSAAGPQGKFTLDQSGKFGQHLMIAGGIGITPFRSMIKYSLDAGLNLPITLLYSNTVPEEIIFAQELDEYESALSLQVVHTITHPEESKQTWSGRVGRIDENLIKQYATNLNQTIFYICGPAKMVAAFKELLLSMQIPAEQIRFELFSGY